LRERWVERLLISSTIPNQALAELTPPDDGVPRDGTDSPAGAVTDRLVSPARPSTTVRLPRVRADLAEAVDKDLMQERIQVVIGLYVVVRNQSRPLVYVDGPVADQERKLLSELSDIPLVRHV
jgi:hypothetical protein